MRLFVSSLRVAGLAVALFAAAIQHPVFAQGASDFGAAIGQIDPCLGLNGRKARIAAVVDYQQQVLSEKQKRDVQTALETALSLAGVQLVPFADSGQLLEIADAAGIGKDSRAIAGAAGSFDAIALARSPVLQEKEISLSVDVMSISGTCKSAPVALLVALSAEPATSDLDALLKDFAQSIIALRPAARGNRIAICPVAVRDGDGSERPSACSTDLQARMAEAMLSAASNAGSILRDERLEITRPSLCNGLRGDAAAIMGVLRNNNGRHSLSLEASRGDELLALRSPRQITGLDCDSAPSGFVAQFLSESRGASPLRIEGKQPFRVGDPFSVTLSSRRDVEIACWILSDRAPDGSNQPSAYMLTDARKPYMISGGTAEDFPRDASLGTFRQATPVDRPDLLHCFAAPMFTAEFRVALKNACGDACTASGGPRRLLEADSIARLAKMGRAETKVSEAHLLVNVID
jgi:hypothetical protein